MPDYTVSLTTAQGTRARKAMSFIRDDGKNATNAQITAWLLRQLRGKVAQYELGVSNAVAETTKREELATEGW